MVWPNGCLYRTARRSWMLLNGGLIKRRWLRRASREFQRKRRRGYARLTLALLPTWLRCAACNGAAIPFLPAIAYAPSTGFANANSVTTYASSLAKPRSRVLKCVNCRLPPGTPVPHTEGHRLNGVQKGWRPRTPAFSSAYRYIWSGVSGLQFRSAAWP